MRISITVILQIYNFFPNKKRGVANSPFVVSVNRNGPKNARSLGRLKVCIPTFCLNETKMLTSCYTPLLHK